MTTGSWSQYTNTRFKFSNTLFMGSERHGNFAEVYVDVITAYWNGSRRLKLCFPRFAMSCSSESLSPSRFFFDFQTVLLSLCPQELIDLKDSTYLDISRDDDYRLFNYSKEAKESGEPIAGCMSCLLRPSFNGLLETPDGALVLKPDPRICQCHTGLIFTIKQHQLIPNTVCHTGGSGEKTSLHMETVEPLWLNLIFLPERSGDDEVSFFPNH